MPLIMFTKDRATVEEHPQVFKAGEVYDLPEESCERWKRRGVAIDAAEPTPEPEDKPVPVKTAKGKKAEA